MDELERYLDRVCRGIGGPKSLRQHVRQELREHLLDAAAGHKAAGVPEDRALSLALEEFGGPDEVRSELAATHGQRLLGVVIDRALHWKETTLKAKWLWATWAYLAAAAVIVAEVLSITFAVMFIVPKFYRLMQDGLVDPGVLDDQGAAWMVAFLHRLDAAADQSTWLLLATVAAWGLFEWRVRGENKPLMRLAALGTAALGLAVVALLTWGSLAVGFCLGLPSTGKVTRLYAVDQVASIDASVAAAERALEKQDWAAAREQATRASAAVERLAKATAAVGALTPQHGPPTLQDLRSQLAAANDALRDALAAPDNPDRLAAAFRKFRDAYGPVAKAAAGDRR
ncbi:MAG: permease prefix domain 1-containing protein [Gemmataceae bacterium]